MDDILAGNRYPDSTGGLLSLREKIDEYSRRFNHIDKIVYDFRNKFDRIKPFHMQYSVFFRIIETTFLERPLVNAELIENIFHLKKITLQSETFMSLIPRYAHSGRMVKKFL